MNNKLGEIIKQLGEISSNIELRTRNSIHDYGGTKRLDDDQLK